MACDCGTCDATPADVREVLYARPDLVALTDAELEVWLTVARELLSVSRFGGCLCMLQALAAAHMTADGDGGGSGAAGPVTSERDGPAARSFGMAFSVKDEDGYWATTPYGRRFLAMRMACGRGRGSAIVANTAVRQRG